VIQGDAVAIDAVLDQIWGRQKNDPPELIVCSARKAVSDEVRAYALALGTLLGSHVSHLETAEEIDALAREGAGAEHDLLIVEEAKHSLIRHLQPHAAVLVARCPRWPLERLLLIVQGAGVDDAAVEWVVTLARASGSAVTVLAIVPPLPAMYKGLSRMGQGLPALLATDTALGRGMRQVARQMVAWEIDGTLRLRQGTPDLQIRREVIRTDPDLIVLGAKPGRRSVRRLAGDLVWPLLHQADRPVLVAQTTA
jgi:nucleotide-binding universal stress UspA family protein